MVWFQYHVLAFGVKKQENQAGKSKLLVQKCKINELHFTQGVESKLTQRNINFIKYERGECETRCWRKKT